MFFVPDSTVKISQPFGKLIIKSFDENNESSFSDNIHQHDHNGLNFNEDYKLSNFISPSNSSYYSKSLPRSLSSGNGFIQRNNYDLTNRSSLDIQTNHNTNMNRLIQSSSPSPNQTSSSLSSPTPPTTFVDDEKKDLSELSNSSKLSTTNNNNTFKSTVYARPPHPPPSTPIKMINNTPNNRKSLPNSYEEVRRINNILNSSNNQNENSDQESVKLKPFIPGKVLIQQDTSSVQNNGNESSNSSITGERRAISQIRITPNLSYSSPKSDMLNDNSNTTTTNTNNNNSISKTRFKNFKLIENSNHLNQLDNNNNNNDQPQQVQQQQQQQRNKKSFKQLILNMGSKMVNI